MDGDGEIITTETNAKKRKKRFQRHLTYDEIRNFHPGVRRICRVAEPFLAGIQAKVRDELFRIGVPDLPEPEKDRLVSQIIAKV
jgi:hypothetical protein